MQTRHLLWSEEKGWTEIAQSAAYKDPHLVLYFGELTKTPAKKTFAIVRQEFPNAHIVGCNSAAYISNDELFEEGLVAIALQFEHSKIRVEKTKLLDTGDSYDAGRRVAEALDDDALRGIFVLSDGVILNGSELSRGLNSIIAKKVPIFGGMAADGARFESTPVACNGPAQEHLVAAVGFYGEKMHISCGSEGGWVTFGPQRNITKSKNNKLYELDGQPALSLYKKYLGEEAQNLPASALSFPLMISDGESTRTGVVRSVIGVDEQENSLTFAGDIRQGYMAQLMRTSHEGLINGAGSSAQNAMLQKKATQLALLVSCIGRKQILRQHTEDEIETVHEILGFSIPKAGFYSHGEFSPNEKNGFCELHNQTMTIALLGEDA